MKKLNLLFLGGWRKGSPQSAKAANSKKNPQGQVATGREPEVKELKEDSHLYRAPVYNKACYVSCFKGGFKVSSGAVTWHRGTYGTVVTLIRF